MKITPVKTSKITSLDKDIFTIFDKYLPKLSEKSVVAVTSKIISITEGRIVKIGQVDKDELIEKESQYYLPRSENPYNVSLTITRNNLIATAGIDESNGNGYYILWPSDPQKSANEIRHHLLSRFNLNKVGVIITDSKTTPLRWGVTAIAIAFSGFSPLKDYIGKDDVFGKKLEYTKMNIIDNLACASALVMGEGSEQTPIAIVEDLPFVQFNDKNPTEEELAMLRISMDEDLYSPFIKSVKWRKGKAK